MDRYCKHTTVLTNCPYKGSRDMYQLHKIITSLLHTSTDMITVGYCIIIISLIYAALNMKTVPVAIASTVNRYLLE